MCFALHGTRIAEYGVVLPLQPPWDLRLPLWIWASHMANSLGLQVPPSIS